MKSFVIRYRHEFQLYKAVFNWRRNYCLTLETRNFHSVKFELSHGFKAFDENYEKLKPFEVVESISKEYDDPVFVFPGFEGKWKFVNDLIRNLRRKVICFQYPFEMNHTDIPSIADRLIPIFNQYADHSKKIRVIAHSFGGLVALSLIKKLDSQASNVRLVLTDSTPYALKFMTKSSFGDINESIVFENNLLCKFLVWAKINDAEKEHYMSILQPTLDWETKLQMLIEKLPEVEGFQKSTLYVIVDAFYRTLQAVLKYDENYENLTPKTTLIRSSTKVLPFPDDFRVQQYFENPVQIFYAKGNHFNMFSIEKNVCLLNQLLEN